MYYKIIISAVAINLALASGAYAVTEDASKNEAATKFVQKASASNLFEIETSKIARARSTNPEVKNFADLIISDHTKAGQELEAAVKKSGVPATALAKSLDVKHQEKLTALQKKDQKDFDDAYMEIQEEAHEDAVELFSDYSQKGENVELKTFATNTLPVLQKHDEHAEKLDDKVD